MLPSDKPKPLSPPRATLPAPPADGFCVFIDGAASSEIREGKGAAKGVHMVESGQAAKAGPGLGKQMARVCPAVQAAPYLSSDTLALLSGEDDSVDCSSEPHRSSWASISLQSMQSDSPGSLSNTVNKVPSHDI